MKNHRKIFGFTVIEMLITVVILGILAAVAVGLYAPYSLKSRRADGVNAILNIQLSEERYRSTNSTYGSLAQLGLSTTSPQGYYTLTTSNVGATTYTITATGTGTQANDTEGATACSPLVLTVSGTTSTPTPAACWPS